MAKHSIVSLLPRFNSTRMVTEYLREDLPAGMRARAGATAETGFESATQARAMEKRTCGAAWPGVGVRRVDSPERNIAFGEGVRLELAVRLDAMKPEDVVVELLIGRRTEGDTLRESRRYRFEWEGVMTDQGEHRFVLQITPEMCGKLEYHIRTYPYHELLTHPFEMGMMRWL